MSKNKMLDSYSYHEALDRAHIQLVNLEASLGDHPIVTSHNDIKKLYDDAVGTLSKLHQKLGKLHFKE